MNAPHGFLAIFLFIIAVFHASAELSISNLKVGISNKLNDVVVKESLNFPEQLELITALAPSEKFILEFEATSSVAPKDEPFILNQATLYFTSSDNTMQVPVLAKLLSSKNKYKAVLTGKKIQAEINKGGKYNIDLAIGSFAEEKGLVYNLGSIKIENGAFSTQEHELKRKPEISHIFAQPEGMVNPVISYVFTLASLVPFIAFFAYLKSAKIDVSGLSNASVFSYIFYLCILACTGLTVAYWVKIRIFDFLFYMLIAAVPTLIFGRLSLKI